MTAELTDNAIQLLTVLICVAYSGFMTLKIRSRKWLLLTLFYISFGIGLIYWVLYIVLFDSTPRVFCVSELSWTASYIFLAMRLTSDASAGASGGKTRLAWILPLFSFVMCVFFCLKGSYLENIMMGLTLSVCGYCSAKRIILSKCRRQFPDRYISLAVLFFYFSEYALWISSYFQTSYHFINPYFLIDTFILNSAIVCIAIAQRREDKLCHTI